MSVLSKIGPKAGWGATLLGAGLWVCNNYDAIISLSPKGAVPVIGAICTVVALFAQSPHKK